MKTPPRELVDLLRRHDPAVQRLALDLRARVVAELAPIHEYIFTMRSKLALLYSTTERVIADGVCHIGVYTKHVTLVFTAGVDLPDPGGVLRGAGKTMRHVPVRSSADLERPEIAALLRAARRHAGIRRSLGGSAEVTTRVKASAQTAERRPARKAEAGLRALGFYR